MIAPIIYRLRIEGFRSIKSLEWHPRPGMNIILGGGDVGKTTLLDAIGLLLSPTNPPTLPDFEYYRRDLTTGFTVEAVMHLPVDTLINQQRKASWPWEWDGKAPVVPTLSDGAVPGEPVYVLRVCGTPDLELEYEIVQPSGETVPISTGLRRAIGLVRLSGDDRNDRDLRLLQGSALDRLLSDKTLRSRLGRKLAGSEVRDALEDEKKATLLTLDKAFERMALPNQLDLSIIGAQGVTITSLIGLTANREGVQLPLASWGAGTRRLAALEIAKHNHVAFPITLVDEIERGLEPYRQRLLISKLQSGDSQVFLTTHSAVVISAATSASVWHFDHSGHIGCLDHTKIARHQQMQPETFLSRLAIVAEGAAEVGFVSALLEKALGASIDQYGIYVSNGGGHEATLDLLQALSDAGIHLGAFIDDEGKHSGTLRTLADRLGSLLFKWKTGCLEENIITKLTSEALERFISDSDGSQTGERLRTLSDRLDLVSKDFIDIQAKAGNRIYDLVIGAARGTVPLGKQEKSKEFKKHSQRWFKTVEGGRELLTKVFEFDLWPHLKDEVFPFINAVRKAVGLCEIADFPQ
jgi:putative ATP-dependent endonuclease of the OLD family